MYNLFIIDKGRKEIKNLLLQVEALDLSGVNFIGSATSAKVALTEIQRKEPEILITEVDMEDGKAFEILSSIDYFNRPKTIFTSKYQERALEIFDYEPVDFLLKPFSMNRLQQAIEKAIAVIKEQEHQKQVTMTNQDKILLEGVKRLYIVDFNDILRLEADRNFSHVYLQNGDKYLLANNLGQITQNNTLFPLLRCHRSHLVNANHITDFISIKQQAYFILTDGTKVPISRSKKNEMLQWLTSNK